MRKQVLFIANSLDNAYKFQQVLRKLDVIVSAGTTAQLAKLLAPGSIADLVVFEACSSAFEHFGLVASMAEERGCPLLVIADKATVGAVKLPGGIPCDFVMSDALLPECLVRVKRLLAITMRDSGRDIITVGDMTLNLATYQVAVSGEAVDLTYLEYALLAFLVRHPDRVHTREELLVSVWGTDYYGGSRTVDVHVRRIRAKLGPALAHYIETVRCVGYLWRSEKT